MPKITLTESEYKRLAGDEGEPTRDMDPEDYLAARDARIAEAQARGDEETAEKLLAEFPHPAELASRDHLERTRQIDQQLEARRPQTEEEQEAFYRGLDEIPDGDKAGVKAYLAKHGYITQSDRVALESS